MGILGLAFTKAAAETLIEAGMDVSPQGPIERAITHVSKLGL